MSDISVRQREALNFRSGRADPDQRRFGLSIVIICHNSGRLLPATLACLKAQKVTEDIPWEVVIVDNASTDNTVAVAKKSWRDHNSVPLRIVEEPRLGQAFARERGASEARYEFVSYVDDDNWVSEDWVERAATFMRDHSDAGAVGGSSVVAADREIPKWFEDCKVFYAISDESWEAGDCTHTRPAIWTAGMTFRKSAWEAVVLHEAPLLATGRKGKSMAGGEDSEFCYRLRMAGWKLWYEPRLRFQHYMPSQRLEWEYTRRLYRGSGEASALLFPYEAICNPRTRFPKLRRTWEWQFLRAVESLLLHLPALLKGCLSSREGDLEILAADQAWGFFRGLARSRSSYYQGLNTVTTLVHSMARAATTEVERAALSC